jgi:hypothetical protein
MWLRQKINQYLPLYYPLCQHGKESYRFSPERISFSREIELANLKTFTFPFKSMIYWRKSVLSLIAEKKFNFV